MNNINKLEFAYLLMKSKYVSQIRKIYPNISDELIIPTSWNNSSNYEEKIKILNTAIKEKKLITEVFGFEKFEEGVRNNAFRI